MVSQFLGISNQHYRTAQFALECLPNDINISRPLVIGYNSLTACSFTYQRETSSCLIQPHPRGARSNEPPFADVFMSLLPSSRSFAASSRQTRALASAVTSLILLQHAYDRVHTCKKWKKKHKTSHALKLHPSLGEGNDRDGCAKLIHYSFIRHHTGINRAVGRLVVSMS